ncbi:MAG: sulfur carrier protein ThiS [Gammaproteobacteria bacterium]|nr:sulfur carrier protein ThiS [Gammaproteobacteria bacterium]
MSITLNGKATEVSAHTTLATLVATHALSNKRIAIEVNQAIVPRSLYKDTVLKPEDRVEVIYAIGGG